jgi:hypothetical protein
MKILKIFENGTVVFSSDLDKVSAQTLENHKKPAPKPEIRHGQLAIYKSGQPRLIVKHGDSLDATREDGEITGPGAGAYHGLYSWLDISIFDLLAEAMKGKKEYYIDRSKYYVPYSLRLTKDGNMEINNAIIDHKCLDEVFQGIFSLYVQHKLAGAKQCKQ